MRTEKVKLSGTHFFLRTEKQHFSNTHDPCQKSLATLRIPHIFAVSKGREDIEKLSGKWLIPFSKLGSSLRRIVRENQGHYR